MSPVWPASPSQRSAASSIDAPVADETVRQVRSAIELLNYTPMAAARTLAGHKTNTIGLLLPQISSAFFSPLVSGIQSGAREAGFDMIVHLAADPHNREDRPEFAAVGEHNTDGSAIFTDRLNNATITRFWRNGLPMVLLFRTAPEGLADTLDPVCKPFRGTCNR